MSDDDMTANLRRSLAGLDAGERQAFLDTLATVAALPALTARDKRHRKRLRRLCKALNPPKTA